MIKKVAIEFSKSLSSNQIIKEGDEDVYVFGMEVLISTVLNFILLLSVGGILHRFWETVAFLAVYCSIRCHSGGYHAKSQGRCILTFFVVYMCIMLFFMKYPIERINIFLMIGWMGSFLLLFFLSPFVDSKRHVDEAEKRRFKTICRRTMIVITLILGGGYFVLPALRWILVYGIIGFITVGSLFFAGIMVKKWNGFLGER